MARKSFLLRIDQKLYDELEAWAQHEMRSVNGQIEYLLRQATLRYKNKGAILDVRNKEGEFIDDGG